VAGSNVLIRVPGSLHAGADWDVQAVVVWLTVNGSGYYEVSIPAAVGGLSGESPPGTVTYSRFGIPFSHGQAAFLKSAPMAPGTRIVSVGLRSSGGHVFGLASMDAPPLPVAQVGGQPVTTQYVIFSVLPDPLDTSTQYNVFWDVLHQRAQGQLTTAGKTQPSGPLPVTVNGSTISFDLGTASHAGAGGPLLVRPAFAEDSPIPIGNETSVRAASDYLTQDETGFDQGGQHTRAGNLLHPPPITSSGGTGIPWTLILLVAVLVLLAILAGVLLLLRRAGPVLIGDPPRKPPGVKDCSAEKAALDAAEAAMRSLADRLRTLEALRAAAQQAAAAAKTAHEAAGRAREGAIQQPTPGPDGKPYWTYKSETQRHQAEAADRAAEAADAKAAAAQSAYDAAGGDGGFQATTSNYAAAVARYEQAQAAYAACSGSDVQGVDTSTPIPVPPVTHGVEGPPVVARPPCTGTETKTVEVCKFTITENHLNGIQVTQDALTHEAYGLDTQQVRDLIEKYKLAKQVVDVSSKFKGTLEDPMKRLDELADEIPREQGEKWMREHHKLPPNETPGSYTDMMSDAVIKGMGQLVDVLDDPNYMNTIADYTAVWMRVTYDYKGTITCRCENGRWVRVDESFGPVGDGHVVPVIKEVGQCENQDELGRALLKATNEARLENARADATLKANEEKMKEARCQ
ncbi:MAG TPA: hypothetical protein VF134_01450, partial [Candidatus Dormibacteraeota bacterium]